MMHRFSPLRPYFCALVALLLPALVACDDFFGEKTERDFIEVPNYDSTTVAYVPVQPALDQFQAPIDVYAGFDELLYVIDSATQELVQLDQAGRTISRLQVPGIKAIAQDRRLHLLMIGTIDTVINGTNYTLDAIFRMNPYKEGTGDYGLSADKMLDTIVHPFYFKTSFSAGDADVRLKDLDVFADNSYLVVREGPSNSATQFGGPDDAVLEFSRKDEWQGALTIATDQGNIRNYFNDPVSITTRAKPPQGPFVNTTKDFIVGQSSPAKTLKVEYFIQEQTSGGKQFALNTDLIRNDTSQADGFLYTANNFTRPVGLSYTGDGDNHLFVTDAARDSLYLFTNTGLEGVSPPPASSAEKQINVSFGGTGSAPTSFRNPSGVANAADILYVADKGNGRVSRFRLTTDFD